MFLNDGTARNNVCQSSNIFTHHCFYGLLRLNFSSHVRRCCFEKSIRAMNNGFYKSICGSIIHKFFESCGKIFYIDRKRYIILRLRQKY